MNQPIRLEALLEQFEPREVFAEHLDRDYKGAQEEGSVLGVVYVQFTQPVNMPVEENRAVLAALSPDFFLSRTVACDGGKAFIGFYETQDSAKVHGEIDRRAGDIRAQLVQSNAPVQGTASYIAKSGELSAVEAYGKALAQRSHEEGTHWHDHS